MRRRFLIPATAWLLLATAGCRGGAAEVPPQTPQPEQGVRHPPTGLTFPAALVTDAGFWSRSGVERGGDSVTVGYSMFATLPYSARIGVEPLPPGADAAEAFEQTKIDFGRSEPSSRAVGGGTSDDLLLGQPVGEPAEFSLYRSDGLEVSPGTPFVVLLAMSDLARRGEGGGRFAVTLRAEFAAGGEDVERSAAAAAADLMNRWRAANGLAVPATRPAP